MKAGKKKQTGFRENNWYCKNWAQINKDFMKNQPERINDEFNSVRMANLKNWILFSSGSSI